ncbi:CC0125/CC1285 family lipoprotein [Algihabitans albus]|uniref:CC0125/CC1285 family lipoprotein n=1 Tax=Algihabitans albus TaxID=2164067 RepID=UPI001ABD4402|nr:hypothetical protein [Algihabitans albus]
MKPIVCRSLLAVALLCLLAACASPTPYQPVEDRFGYAVQPLETDRYRVSFAGNSSTPRETVEDFLLYRAAEVTLDKGQDYFLLVDRDTERLTSFRTTGSGFGSFSRFGGSPFYGRGFAGPSFATATTRPRDRFTAYAQIVVRQGEKPVDDPNAFDARDVLERLGPNIVRPEES